MLLALLCSVLLKQIQCYISYTLKRGCYLCCSCPVSQSYTNDTHLCANHKPISPIHPFPNKARYLTFQDHFRFSARQTVSNVQAVNLISTVYVTASV